jgi:hypothetical protein
LQLVEQSNGERNAQDLIEATAFFVVAARRAFQ